MWTVTFNVIVFRMQSASPSRLSSTSDGSASSTTGTVTGDLDSSLHHGSSSSVRRRQVVKFDYFAMTG